MTSRNEIREADEWAALDELHREFAGQWDITWSEFPGGRMFAARPLPPDGQSPWVVRRDAGELRDEILRREGRTVAAAGQVAASAA